MVIIVVIIMICWIVVKRVGLCAIDESVMRSRVVVIGKVVEVGRLGIVGCAATLANRETIEGRAKLFRVEGVDDGIDGRVEVAEPSDPVEEELGDVATR